MSRTLSSHVAQFGKLDNAVFSQIALAAINVMLRSEQRARYGGHSVRSRSRPADYGGVFCPGTNEIPEAFPVVVLGFRAASPYMLLIDVDTDSV